MNDKSPAQWRGNFHLRGREKVHHCLIPYLHEDSSGICTHRHCPDFQPVVRAVASHDTVF
jgi:hypothetical protein